MDKVSSDINDKVKVVLMKNWKGINAIQAAFPNFNNYFPKVFDALGTLTDGLICEAINFVMSWGSDAQEKERCEEVDTDVTSLKKALMEDMEIFFEAHWKYENKKMFGRLFMDGMANY